MKFKCKLISALLAVLMLMSMACAGVSAAVVRDDITGHQYAADIIKVFKKGGISVDNNGNFRPDDDITQAEFVKLINSMYNYVTVAKSNFNTIKSDATYAKDYLLAKAAGYLAVGDDIAIAPDAKVTLAEAAVMIYRAAQLTKAVTYTAYKDDAKIPEYAKDAVYALRRAGIMSADNTGYFHADDTLSRGYACYLLVSADTRGYVTDAFANLPKFDLSDIKKYPYYIETVNSENISYYYGENGLTAYCTKCNKTSGYCTCGTFVYYPVGYNYNYYYGCYPNDFYTGSNFQLTEYYAWLRTLRCNCDEDCAIKAGKEYDEKTCDGCDYCRYYHDICAIIKLPGTNNYYYPCYPYYYIYNDSSCVSDSYYYYYYYYYYYSLYKGGLIVESQIPGWLEDAFDDLDDEEAEKWYTFYNRYGIPVVNGDGIYALPAGVDSSWYWQLYQNGLPTFKPVTPDPVDPGFTYPSYYYPGCAYPYYYPGYGCTDGTGTNPWWYYYIGGTCIPSLPTQPSTPSRPSYPTYPSLPQAKVYTVTFDLNYECNSPIYSKQNVKCGERISIESPTRKGYIFAGWYLDSPCTKSFSVYSPVSSSFTLYAKWIKNNGQPGTPWGSATGIISGATGGGYYYPTTGYYYYYPDANGCYDEYYYYTNHYYKFYSDYMTYLKKVYPDADEATLRLMYAKWEYYQRYNTPETDD